MWTPLWGVVVALLIAGLILGVWGMRGRRVGNLPHCRRCGYELSGKDADHCPECGHGLLGAGGIIRGRRVRRKAALAASPIALLLAVLLATVLLASGETGMRWNTRKPFGMLLWECGSYDPAIAEAAAAELAQRSFDRKLTGGQEARLLARALEVHVDSARLWSPSLDGAIDRAISDGRLRGEALRQYVSNLARPELLLEDSSPLAPGERRRLVYRVRWRAGMSALLRSQLRFETRVEFAPGQPAFSDPNLRHFSLPNDIIHELFAGFLNAPPTAGSHQVSGTFLLKAALPEHLPEVARPHLRTDELPEGLAGDLAGWVQQIPVRLQYEVRAPGANPSDERTPR